MQAAAVAIAAVAIAATAAALIGWGDGDPGPWIWIAFAAAPAGALIGGTAWLRDRGETPALTRAAAVASILVSALWVVVLALIIRGLR